jgi:hypothetical protein
MASIVVLPTVALIPVTVFGYLALVTYRHRCKIYQLKKQGIVCICGIELSKPLTRHEAHAHRMKLVYWPPSHAPEVSATAFGRCQRQLGY